MKKLKRFSKDQLKKYYAEQLLLPAVVEPKSEPHTIVRCMACDEPKIEFHRSGDDEMYYKCPRCGFESEP
jgi:hypothetical protein